MQEMNRVQNLTELLKLLLGFKGGSSFFHSSRLIVVNAAHTYVRIGRNSIWVLQLSREMEYGLTAQKDREWSSLEASLCTPSEFIKHAILSGLVLFEIDANQVKTDQNLEYALYTNTQKAKSWSQPRQSNELPRRRMLLLEDERYFGPWKKNNFKLQRLNTILKGPKIC